MTEVSTQEFAFTIGIDLGDKRHQICRMDPAGQIVAEGPLTNSLAALEKMFGGLARSLVALEAGTHSPWIAAALAAWGHTVLVANPHELAAITASQQKSDLRDARMLARLARVDPTLLRPLEHRSAQAQADLALLKARHALVKARTALIAACRGMVKSAGARLPKCSAASFAKQAQAAVPLMLREALEPLVRQVGELSEKIVQFERKLERVAEERYPDCERLREAGSVGPITALCFMLVLDEAARFKKSRAVGAYIGLAPKKDQSGAIDKQCRISKAGHPYLRVLLVQCAQHLLGRNGRDCELRRWGLKLCARGGKAAKKRAVVATARRLAVQLHALWVSAAPYDPFHAESRRAGGGGASSGGGGAAGASGPGGIARAA